MAQLNRQDAKIARQAQGMGHRAAARPMGNEAGAAKTWGSILPHLATWWFEIAFSN